MKAKIIKKKLELFHIIRNEREKGKIIVTTNGTFDILHPGHIRLFEYAKNLGDILVIGLNSDKSVKKYKDPERPFVSENDRAEVLSALRYIDYIYIFNEETPIRFIKAVKPHIHVNASTYGKDCIERKAVEEKGGRIELFDIIGDYSTTNLVKKIRGEK